MRYKQEFFNIKLSLYFFYVSSIQDYDYYVFLIEIHVVQFCDNQFHNDFPAMKKQNK